MKKFCILFACLFFCTNSQAWELVQNDTNQPVAVTCTNQINTAKTDQIGRSGCCSHHDGVCGCAGGRQQCCDGTLSPSCICHKVDQLNVPKT
jgi:hypothetical protein